VARFTVFVTDDRYGSYREEEEVLSEIDARLLVRNFRSEEEATRELAEADGVLVNLFPMSAQVIGKLSKCRVISRYGVGYDNVDIAAATREGIWVARVPDYATEDVSDHALALLLSCVRRIAYRDRKIRAGAWNVDKGQSIHRIAGKTLGLIGYGAIARRLHVKVAGLGLGRVLVFDPLVDTNLITRGGALSVDFLTLIRESDFISIHVPLSDETRGMLGRGELAMMRRDAIVVNTSRGGVVNEAALAEAVGKGVIAGAGLDVFEVEPLPPDSPLRKLDAVILSDHAGWYSDESLVELKTKAAQNIVAVLEGGKPVYPINAVRERGNFQ